MPVKLRRTSTVSESGRGEQQKRSRFAWVRIYSTAPALRNVDVMNCMCVQLQCDIPAPTEAMLLLVAGSVICTLTVSVTLAAVDIQTESTASVTAVPVWCYCRKEESGDMVACVSGSCKYEWFHFACVGLLSEPKGMWFCPECRKEKRKEQMQKRWHFYCDIVWNN